MEKIVIDANVLIKLFREESDTEIARSCLRHIIENDIVILAPQLLITETMNVCISQGVERGVLLNFFEAQLTNNLQLVDLNIAVLTKATEISESGHEKSGYPSFNDSVYHAIALDNDATLITADRRHYTKVKKFGNIKLLESWEKLFSD